MHEFACCLCKCFAFSQTIVIHSSTVSWGVFDKRMIISWLYYRYQHAKQAHCKFGFLFLSWLANSKFFNQLIKSSTLLSLSKQHMRWPISQGNQSIYLRKKQNVHFGYKEKEMPICSRTCPLHRFISHSIFLHNLHHFSST